MESVSKADILIAGVGPAVLKELEEGGLPSRVRLLDAGPAPHDILVELTGIKKLIVVDVLTGVEPGSIAAKRFPALSALPEDDGALSHGINLLQTLRMARALAPEIDILIIGAGIAATSVAPGLQLSDSLRERIPALVALIHEELSLTAQHG